MVYRLDRRTFLTSSAKLAGGGLLVASGAGGLLTACGSSTAPRSGSRVNKPSGRPRRGGNLRVGVWTEETTLLPLQGTWDGIGICYGMGFFDPLAAVAADGTVIPYLAQSITPNADHTVWTITLRPNVVFHDGTPLDAAAAVANNEAFLASPTLGYILNDLASVKPVGPLSYEVTMKRPWVSYAAYLTTAFMQATKTLPASYKGPPIGTGPFVYKDWQPGDHLYLTRNPHYWRPGLPYLDQLTFRPILNSQQKENSLRAGDIDVALVGNTIDDMGSLRADKSLQSIDGSTISRGIRQFHSTGVQPLVYWLLNCAVPPTNDVRVRNALAYATDQPTFWKQVFGGAGSAGGEGSTVPVTGPFLPGSQYFSATGYPARRDLAKARSLISSYAAEHGTPKITLTASTERRELQAQQLTQSMWQAAGAKVTIEQLDVGTLIQRGLKGQTQAVFWDFGGAVDPDQNYLAWSPAYSAPVGTIALNEQRLTDARLTPLLDAGRTNADPKVRAQAYQKVASIFGEQTPFIYMGQSVGGYAARNSVENLTTLTSPDGKPMLWAQPGLVVTQIALSA